MDYRCYSVGTIYCGNGRLDEGEQCDPGDPEKGIPPVIPDVPPPEGASFPMCTPYCTITMARCGNGLVESNGLDGTMLRMEECDDGNDVAGDGCSPDCKVEPGYCDATELARFGTERCEGWCGDGVKNGPEVCDGSDLGGFSCEYFGYHGGTLRCRDDCSGFDPSGCEGWCGDGVRNGPEECDGADPRGCSELFGAVAGPLHCTAYCTLSDARCMYGWRNVSPLSALGQAADLVEVTHGPDGWYAVSDEGYVLRYDGSWAVWTLQDDVTLTSVTTYGDLVIAAGTDPNGEVLLYSFDGASWNPFPAPENASSPPRVVGYPSSLYLVTPDTVWQWNGAEWSVLVTSSQLDSATIFSFALDDALGPVVGTMSGIYWQQEEMWVSEGGGITPVYDLDASNGWMAVAEGWWMEIYHDGNMLDTFVLPHASRMDEACVWPDGGTLGYAALEDSLVYRVDTSWLMGPVPFFGQDVRLACYGQRAMAVGAKAYASLFMGSLSVRTDDPWPVSYWVNAARHTPDGYAYVLLTDEYYGAGSMVLICKDAACETVRLTGETCRALWAVDSTTFAVGCERGRVAVRSGEGAAPAWLSPPTTREVTAVWLGTDGTIMAGDELGHLFMYDGSSWSNVTPEGTDGPVEDMAVVGDFGLAVAGSSVFVWDGSMWKEDLRVSGTRFYATAVFSGYKAFAAGTGGTIYEYDGSSWHRVDSPVTSTVLAMEPMDNGSLFVLGEDETAYVFDGVTWGRVRAQLDDDLVAGARVTPTRWWLISRHGPRVDVVFGPSRWGDAPVPVYCGSVVTDALDATGTHDAWCSAEGLEGGERIYTLDVPVDGKVDISLDSLSNNTRLFVLRSDGTCLAETDGGDSQVVTVNAGRGTSLTVVVDGAGATSFTLDVRCYPQNPLLRSGDQRDR